MRSSDGREFRVVIDQGREPRRLSRGDRVRVNGYFTSGLFIAQNVNITSNVGNGNRPGTTWGNRPGTVWGNRPGATRSNSLSGVVIGDLAGREFRMRSSDGREFRVVIDQGREPRRLSRGDRVTVNGYFSSGIFIANNVSITRNVGNGNRPYYGTPNRPYYGTPNRPYSGGTTTGRSLSLSGIVIGDLAGREFRMRSSDGREFRVVIDQGREPRRLSRGDRVHVHGYFTSGIFIANNVNITSNRTVGGYNPGSPQYGNGQVTFTGTVANIDSSTKLWVRAYNGTTYEVVTSTPISRAISVGDVVRVNGYGTASSLRAGRVILVRNIR